MPIAEYPKSNSSSNSGGLVGTWDASTNTPTLSNTDTGKLGVMYQVSDPGTVDFGDGAKSFDAKDIVINNGTTWDKIDAEDLVLSDSQVETAYNNRVAIATQAEAEAGTLTSVKRFTPERIKQAIAALATGLYKMSAYTDNQSISSTSYSYISGTTLNILGHNLNYILWNTEFSLKIPNTTVTSVDLRFYSPNYSNALRFRAKITNPIGDVTWYNVIPQMGSYPGGITEEYDFSIDTSGASANDCWAVEIYLLLKQPNNGIHKWQAKIQGSNFCTIEGCFTTLLQVG